MVKVGPWDMALYGSGELTMVEDKKKFIKMLRAYSALCIARARIREAFARQAIDEECLNIWVNHLRDECKKLDATWRPIKY